jgi:dTDP-4-dehydrorhamnose reductase
MVFNTQSLVLGNGFVGKEFERHGFTVKDRKFVTVDEIIEGDYSKFFLDEFLKYDYIINCIGVSDTRYCEDKSNWEEVHRVNGVFVKYLSNLCSFYKKKLVHISTGCLYEGTKGLKYEDDFLETHCNYTVSKMVGELNCNNEHLIIRPRLLFNEFEDKKNLLTKFSKFDRYLNEFNTVTSTEVIVKSVVALIENNCSGVYNIGNTGNYTIEQLAEAFGMNTEKKHLTQSELISSQGLHLVNNVMSMNKLIKDTGYIPEDAYNVIQKIGKNGLKKYDSDK